jgi:hypothetical protein
VREQIWTSNATLPRKLYKAVNLPRLSTQPTPRFIKCQLEISVNWRSTYHFQTEMVTAYRNEWSRQNLWLISKLHQALRLILFIVFYNHLPCVKHTIYSQLNWAILLRDVIPDRKTESNAQFWQAIAHASELSFPAVFHIQNCAVHVRKPTVSSVYLSTHDSFILRDSTELTKKTTNLMGNLYCAREHSFQLFVQLIYTVTLHGLT